ncbi:MAG: HAD-IIIA family hydrolase [Tepidisphaeraceae bacterium]|jgi:D-glycero-D-manno-heptose 1,7-bisphosphate phosphatase
MKKPAIFFDRDNTLIVSDGYLGDPAQVRLIAGAADAVARARAMGFAVVTISNQSGVARGLFGEEAVAAVNEKLEQLLSRESARAKIDRHEFCPFHPEAVVERYRKDSELRKPRPGMILRAAEAMDLDLSASWVLGDSPRDIEAGHAAGCRTILVSDLSLSASPAAQQPGNVEPDETVSNLGEAMDIVEAVVGTESLHQHSVQPDRSAAQVSELTKIEHLAQAILDQVRRQNEHVPEFSLGKMLAGITQILAIALAVGSYFYKPPSEPLMPILVAIFLQALTISLLLMGRER